MEIAFKQTFFYHGITTSKKSLHNLFRLSGPILESKDVRAFFLEKGQKQSVI